MVNLPILSLRMPFPLPSVRLPSLSSFCARGRGRSHRLLAGPKSRMWQGMAPPVPLRTLPRIFQWAGGKTKMLASYAPLLPQRAPAAYVEPFAGGAALFAHLCASGRRPGSVLLGDTNGELMGLYHAIAHDLGTFLDEVRPYDALWAGIDADARRTTYYAWRARYWGLDAGEAASTQGSALLYALMRTSFNGIWQTCAASRGRFGTPVGLVDKRGGFLQEAALRAWSEALQGVQLHTSGFESLIAPQGAFVYCDPPYRDSFTHYSTGFDDADQATLVAWCRRQHREQGATVWLANREAGDGFFEDIAADAVFHRFPVTYTAGRRKKTADGYEAKPATELLMVWS